MNGSDWKFHGSFLAIIVIICALTALLFYIRNHIISH